MAGGGRGERAEAGRGGGRWGWLLTTDWGGCASAPRSSGFCASGARSRWPRASLSGCVLLCAVVCVCVVWLVTHRNTHWRQNNLRDVSVPFIIHEPLTKRAYNAAEISLVTMWTPLQVKLIGVGKHVCTFLITFPFPLSIVSPLSSFNLHPLFHLLLNGGVGDSRCCWLAEAFATCPFLRRCCCTIRANDSCVSSFWFSYGLVLHYHLIM